MLGRVLEALLLPPGSVLLLGLIGAWLSWRGKRYGRWWLLAAFALLYLATLPPVGEGLLRSLEQAPALTPHQIQDSDAGTIVVLGAGRYTAAPEYGADTLSPLSLERVRYAAWLQRLTDLPVLASGGSPLGEDEAEAILMARALRQEYAVADVWLESASVNTAENARLSAQQLHTHGIHRILLVTHAWHMARAARMFRQEGLEVIPAPTGFTTTDRRPLLLALLPSAAALQQTRRALHEYLGSAWYQLRYRNGVER